MKLEPVELEWTPTDLSFMHSENPELDKLPERYVLLICGCSPTHPYKRWPVQNFCELAQRLAARGVAPVLIGTNAEAAGIFAVDGHTKTLRVIRIKIRNAVRTCCFLHSAGG